MPNKLFTLKYLVNTKKYGMLTLSEFRFIYDAKTTHIFDFNENLR